MNLIIQTCSKARKNIFLLLLITSFATGVAYSQTSIFTTQIPVAITDNDHKGTVGQELGVKFTSGAAGFITGIRFYKTAGNEGAHIGELYSSAGVRLAQATFINENSTGWQTVYFATPVAVTANTKYVAAYFSNLGNYTEDNDYFKGKSVTNNPLTAPADGTNGANGTDAGTGQGFFKYTASPAFPNQLYRSANYWVDVVYSATATAVVANAGPDADVQISDQFPSTYLSASASTGNITSYQWTLVSGPNTPSFESPNSSYNYVSGLVKGIYVFRLSLNGGVSVDTIKLNVSFLLPAIGLNSDQTIILPNNSTSLIAGRPYRSATLIFSYLWKQVSGPNNANINFPSESVAEVHNLIEGEYVFQVAATGTGGTDTAYAKIHVLKAGRSPNIFTTQVPAEGISNANQGIEVGVNFRSNSSGYISGIRFFKKAGNTGIHTGELYKYDGTRLASAVFTNETSAGWQTVNFDTPIPIESYVDYIAAYHSAGGYYTATPEYLISDVVNNPLYIRSYLYSGENGVFKLSDNPTFPSNSDGKNENYWVDVVYTNKNGGVEANAGIDQTIYVGDTLQLNGGGSKGKITSYAWSLISSPASDHPIITTPNAVSTTVVGLEPTIGGFFGSNNTYIYQLSLNNDASVSQVSVHVLNTTARAGTDQTIQYPVSTVTLDGSKSSGKITSYSWRQTRGPSVTNIVSPASAVTVVNNLTTGLYSFDLTVSGKFVSTVNVNVIPEKDSLFSSLSPVQTTNNDGQAIELGMKFRSSKAGFINGIRFYKTSGNTGSHTGELYTSNGVRLAQAIFTSESVDGWQTATFIPSVAITPNTTYIAAYFSSAGYYSSTGNYFTNPVVNGPLTGLADSTDGANGLFKYTSIPAYPSGSKGNKENYWIDPIYSTISNQAIANAGRNIVIQNNGNTPLATYLDGSGSTGLITSYLWKQISGPSEAILENINAQNVNVSQLALGTYIFQLSVNGGISTSQVTVQVNTAPTPIAFTGPDQIIYLPNNSVTIGAYTSEGTNFQWTQISGPNSAIISTPSGPYASITYVSGLIAGTYIFQLSVNNGASKAQVKVTVSPPPPPVANAGSNQTITLPLSSVTLDGSGSSGTVTGYVWSQVSGPNAAVITTPNDVTPAVSGLVQGTYIFKLTMNGSMSSSQTTVTVLPAAGGTGKNIFTTQVPVASTDNDHNASIGFEAGVKFRSSTAGTITGVRFYKTAGNAGTHIGELYSLSGTRLAQATFTSETATGWQTVSFTTPVTITANTTYVAAYFSSLGNYVEDNGYFNAAVINSPLTALADGTDGGNAPFKYAGSPSFPDQNYQKANYWVDVVFSAGSGPVTPVVANAGPPQTVYLPSMLLLNGSSSTGPITSYAWTTVSGPNTPTFATPNAVSSVVTNLLVGSYVFKLSVNGGASTSTVAVDVNPENYTGYHIFTSEIPAAVTDNDHQATVGHEVGVKFTSGSNGYIGGIRFYKTTGNTGTHIGELYNAAGIRLAQATFVNETASGWQNVLFSTPVPIAAGVTYTAAYFSSLGYYTEDNDFFLHHSVTNSWLTAPEDKTNGGHGLDPGNGQGVFAYAASPKFPNQLYRSANYWVDVLFRSDVTAVASAPGKFNSKAEDSDGTQNNIVYSLKQNYPNPALVSQITRIEYSMPVTSKVELTLYNLQGRKIKVMVNETKGAGNYFYDLNTGTLSKGTYLYSMQALNFHDVKKLVIQ